MNADFLKGKKLGVLLTVGPVHPNFRLAIALLKEAVKRGLKVYLYCVDDGVFSVASDEIQRLKADGVNLFGCAYGANKRKITLTDQAAWSGLTVLSDVIASTERFVCF